MHSNKNYEHVLMTRFNLATPGRESAIRNRPGWLEARFSLFEKYCLPSIAGQTDQRFHWLIYFDEQTPDEFRQRIDRLRKIHPFIPFYTGLFPSDGWSDSILKTFDFQVDTLLTTRLDNDDALALDYMERVHRAVEDQGLAHGGYNFTHGYILANGRLYHMVHPSNAFFSWLGPYTTGMTTAPSIPHMQLAEHGRVYQIEGSAAWIQMIHGGNVSNKIRGQRIHPAKVAGHMPQVILEDLKPCSSVQMFVDNALAGPIRGIRDLLLAIRRRLRKLGN